MFTRSKILMRRCVCKCITKGYRSRIGAVLLKPNKNFFCELIWAAKTWFYLCLCLRFGFCIRMHTPKKNPLILCFYVRLSRNLFKLITEMTCAMITWSFLLMWVWMCMHTGSTSTCMLSVSYRFKVQIKLELACACETHSIYAKKKYNEERDERTVNIAAVAFVATILLLLPLLLLLLLSSSLLLSSK